MCRLRFYMPPVTAFFPQDDLSCARNSHTEFEISSQLQRGVGYSAAYCSLLLLVPGHSPILPSDENENEQSNENHSSKWSTPGIIQVIATSVTKTSRRRISHQCVTQLKQWVRNRVGITRFMFAPLT